MSELPDRKSMQAAIKDINAVLEPKPKLNVIGGADFLAKQIVTSISTCIGGTPEAPTWADPRGGQLSPETIATYEAIVTVQQSAAEAEQAQPEAQPTAGQAAEPEQTQPEAEAQAEAVVEAVYLADGEECAGFVKSLGPKEGDEACAACSKATECAEKAQGTKKPEKAAKPAQPKEPKAPSARGTMLDLLCADPKISKENLLAKTVAAGFKEGEHFKKVTLDTVYSDAQQIFNRLRTNGHLAQ